MERHVKLIGCRLAAFELESRQWTSGRTLTNAVNYLRWANTQQQEILMIQLRKRSLQYCCLIALVISYCQDLL